MSHPLSRRNFLKQASAIGLTGLLPLSLVRLSFANPSQDFTFAYLSDSHIQHIKGTKFVRNWDQGLKRAVAETNLLSPKPDFVLYGGDIAQLGLKEEIDHGLELLSPLRYKTYHALGEHDYYLDLGEYWERRIGPQYYSFDHKGVHFVVLNSILTHDDWINKWPTPMDRMMTMAGLDNPEGSPFMVGDKQREWLRRDLAKVAKTTPLVVLSHSPLQKIFRNWNFWTEDAEQVQALLAPFERVSVLYGHVHQIQYNQIGNISFNSAMATAWPWPYPETYAQAPSHLPVLTVPMNRADPFQERDATGWQFVDIHSGRVALNYSLNDNGNRVVAYNAATGQPEDQGFQPADARIPPQTHY
ncbi:metallophosphoesterase [Thiocystis violacea]|uniref:metallophosphoesterase n=1 Tax=Thiocystis violacea TaxID=13725 RepID=UPI001908F364|nr:metallophosphoesterase [Thiocystis violacea]MBK1718648.1 serine/threonine protein phosphatase [Thiocystis violacea]